MSARYIFGGMGDVLLSLEDALREPEVTLYSHNADAPKLLAPYGVRVRFEHFTDHTRVSARGRAVRQRRYPAFPVPARSMERAAALPLRDRVVGLHPVGSSFSRRLGERRGLPQKWLPPALVHRFVEALDDGRTTFLLFCAPSERGEFETSRPDVRVIAEDDPWDTLACVTRCHRVIAVDSVVKTMSAIRRIPTVVLLGDHRDRYRDRHFITPYVRDGVMKVVRFTDPHAIDVKQVATMVAEWQTTQRPSWWERWMTPK